MNRIDELIELLKTQKICILCDKMEGIIHNVNTPLNTIMGYSQMISTNNPENRFSEKITKAAYQIDDYLKQFSNALENYRKITPDFISLNDIIIQEVALLHHSLFFKHSVKIKLHLDEQMPIMKFIFFDIALLLHLMFQKCKLIFADKYSLLTIETSKTKTSASIKFIFDKNTKLIKFKPNQTLEYEIFGYLIKKYNGKIIYDKENIEIRLNRSE